MSLFDPQDFRDGCGVGFVAARSCTATRKTVEQAFEALKNLAHRGAVDADGKTGDGAGILTRIPKAYYVQAAKDDGVALPAEDFAIGQFFYPHDKHDLEQSRNLVRRTFAKHGLEVLWSRFVPTDESILGKKARAVQPILLQKFLLKPDGMSDADFEQRLFLIRKELDYESTERSLFGFYCASLSCQTIVHKGLFVGDEVRDFYLDLQSPDFVSPYVIFHQRFSTNTFPTWSLAQPFRMLAHNGEINTIQANRTWMRARVLAHQPDTWIPEHTILNRIIIAGRSDSASMDNVLEAYVRGGRTVVHSMVHMMPEAWQRNPHLSDDVKAFYEYHACLTEPFDGPAAVAFCDDRFIGAIVDRNGLRPARYKVTNDTLFVASEVGCVSFDPASVEENGKLSPGECLAFDLKTGKISKDDDVKAELAARQPYGDWLKNRLIDFRKVDLKSAKRLSAEESIRLQTVFGYTLEDEKLILLPMMEGAKEPIGSMGDDIPLASFSKLPRRFNGHFRQMFAQVTNPPIDPIRENEVCSLRMYMGDSGNIFDEVPEHAGQLRLRSPILSEEQLETLLDVPGYGTQKIYATFKVEDGVDGLEDQLLNLCMAAEHAAQKGAQLIVISDRGVSEKRAPIPILLAVSAVHHHLIRVGKRTSVSLIVETGDAREVHDFACLIGYGASAICPYLAIEKVAELARREEVDEATALRNCRAALEKGLLKILAKMGITTLQSYHASQLFEAVGLKNSLVDRYFQGTVSRLSGRGLTEVAADALHWHARAYKGENSTGEDLGLYRFRGKGETHAYNPAVVRSLHKAVKESDAKAFEEYSRLVNEREPMVFRDLLTVSYGEEMSLDQVEPITELVKRFCTPGISYGAISKEVHEDFAIAMNRLGGKSDSGEGGEDPLRYDSSNPQENRSSAIKQVASGRFGVTIQYLVNAQELEIKIAQGAKPGEGGQLPGHKVSEDIARVRHSTPGVTLISPPPHHDIYSIEDLSQLIFDLKQVNPRAKVCVKLVSENGIGTIAAGVAKAGADVILISGHDGGTGASPLSSIRHAGLPWELGLSEVHQVLVHNGLRDRVILRVDGGLKTGFDVVKATLMGAQEFGFGTAAMVSAGCVMVRQCHLNTCPVGIATQNPELRKKYKGSPEQVMRFFNFVAEEVRLHLSRMGFASLQELVGRADLLKAKSIANDLPYNLEALLQIAKPGDNPSTVVLQCIESLDETVLQKSLTEVHITNRDRSFGARLSYHIFQEHGVDGPEIPLELQVKGTTGQSFGCFATKGLHLKLEGEANDYVGKGLSGAKISLKPFAGSTFDAHKNVICGNTCLYGATSGELYANGQAGERFAVRNSGALAVVEGVGDHGCEYMTGGRVVILGPVGKNFGAGLTGGQAFVWDEANDLASFCHLDDVDVLELQNGDEDVILLDIQNHVQETGSLFGQKLLDGWQQVRHNFKKVVPKSL